MKIKIAVGGCRDFGDIEYIFKCLDEYIKELCDEEIIIISGHCSGVDAAAEKYAELRGIKTLLFPAEWKKYGKAAGPVRNKQIVEAADAVIAFWDGKSRGTKSLIDLAKKSGKNLTVFKI